MDYSKIAKENGVLVDYVKYNNCDLLDKLLIAKTPISFMHDGKEYRIIPMFSGVGVSSDGDVICLEPNLKIKKFQKISVMKIYSGSDYVQVYDNLNNKIRQLYVIRLIALAWVPNDDYVKYNCVSNVEPGTPYNANNVKWLSRSDARKYCKNYNSIECVTVNVDTGERLIHISVNQTAIYLGVRVTTLYNKKLPGVIENKKGSFIVDIDNVTEDADIVELYKKLRARYYVVKTKYGLGCTPTQEDIDKAEYFKTLTEVTFRYNLSCLRSVSNINNALSTVGMMLVDMRRCLSTNTYDIKNLVTGKEHLNISRGEVCKILDASESLVRQRIIGVNAGLPYNDWVVKLSDDDNYTYKQKKILVNKYLLKHTDGSVLELYSLKNVAKQVKCNINTVLRVLNRDVRLSGYLISVEP